MKFDQREKANVATIEAYSGISLMKGADRIAPYMGINVASVVGLSIYLDLGPTSAADLRKLADEAEAYWLDWEMFQVHQENDHPEPVYQGDLEADARTYRDAWAEFR